MRNPETPFRTGHGAGRMALTQIGPAANRAARSGTAPCSCVPALRRYFYPKNRETR